MTSPTPTPRNPTGMTIRRADDPTQLAPTGISSAPFRIQHLLEGSQDGETTAMRAMFDPGIITHWHSHPGGQILFVLSGIGAAQAEGGRTEELRAGDCVWFPPDLRHWHGAGPDSPFSYVSIQGIARGVAVEWSGAVREAGAGR